MILLKVSGLAKSVYYYTLAKTDKDEKNKEIINYLIFGVLTTVVSLATKYFIIIYNSRRKK